MPIHKYNSTFNYRPKTSKTVFNVSKKYRHSSISNSENSPLEDKHSLNSHQASDNPSFVFDEGN